MLTKNNDCKVLFVSLILGSFLLASGAGAADVSFWGDKTKWEEALEGQPFATEDFSDEKLNPGVTVVSSSGLGKVNTTNQNWEDALSLNFKPPGSTTWGFTPEMFGWGGDFDLQTSGGLGSGIAVTLEFADGSMQTLSGEIASNRFYGIVSDMPFVKVILTNGKRDSEPAESYHMDDMVYASSVSTCEDDLDLCEGDLDLCEGDLDICEVDLEDAELGLIACLDSLEVLSDLDQDGVKEPGDRCPQTPLGDEVNDDGCSRSQFCEAVETNTPKAVRWCTKAKWDDSSVLPTCRVRYVGWNRLCRAIRY